MSSVDLASLKDYKQRLSEFENAPPCPPAGSDWERSAIDRYLGFYVGLEKGNVSTRVGTVFADNAYFCGVTETHRGLDEIEHHYLTLWDHASRMTIDIEDVARSGDDFYFRWTMEIESSRLGDGVVATSVGMTHVRFDLEGRVLVMYDYWDSLTGFARFMPRG